MKGYQKLKKLRESKGMTIEQMAEMLERTPKTYKRIEDGLTLITGYNFLKRIKDNFPDFDMNELFS
ncbi:helix-turn-helix domain-containing protein [Enterococcus cecorum]|uniref:helix-turn-helix domain-containing protein n=1 Tax=Enterococcus cecorum TaxID=44008 RepID=UPI00148D02D7|nr:helix-turn-helix transcriptional regulator [Enterococcus cecorum]